MPDWNKLIERHRNGELNAVERSAFQEAQALGEVPIPGQDSADVRRGQLVDRMINSRPDSTSEQEKVSLVGAWLEDNGYDPTGVGYFTDDPNGVSGDSMLKMWQNQIDPKRHEDVLSEYMARRVKTKEEKAESDPTFTKENFIAQLEVLAGSGLESYILGNKITDNQKRKAKAGAEEGRLLHKDMMAMRSMYESVIVSKEGLAFARAVAETGLWDNNAFKSLPEEEQPLIGGYIQTIKPKSQEGVLTEAGLALYNGTKDITLGSIDYVGQKAARAYYAGKDLAGDRTANDMLKAMDEVELDNAEETRALEKKFNERGFAGKGVTGVAGSLPLMASFFITGPSGTLATTGKWGKAALAFNKLVKHMPVAMATLSMAKSHEELMVARGADRGVAAPLALATSTLNMYVEKMALDKLIGVSKGKLFKISNDFLAGRLVSGGQGFLSSFATGMTVETAEELIQAFNQEVATQLSLGEADAMKLTQELVNTFVEVLPTTVGFGLAGGIGGGISAGISISDTEAAFTRDAVFRERLDQLTFDPKVTDAEKNESFNTIFNEWEDADTEEDKRDVLEKFNVRNVEEATALFTEETKDRTAFVEEERATLEQRRADKVKFEQETLPALQDEAVKFAEEAGIDSTTFVERITGALTGREVGRLSDNTIEVLSTLSDPLQIVRHEVFHKFLEDMQVLGDAEVELLNGATEKMVQALSEAGLNVSIFEAMEGQGRANEIIVDAAAILNPQELTVWQKVKDVYEKMRNFAKGKGFNSFRSTLQKLETRGFEQTGEAVQGGDRFAERAEQAERSFSELTEAMAVKMVKGDKVDKATVQADMQDNAPYTAEAVVNEAAAIAGELGLEGEAIDMANDAAVRLGVQKIADKRFLESFTKRVQRGGIRAGFRAKEAQFKAQKRKAKAEARAEARAEKKERMSAEANADVDVRSAIAVQGGDMQAVVDGVVDTVKTALGEGVSQNLLDATLKKTLYSVLSKANTALSSARTRASVAKKLEALKSADKLGEQAIIKKAVSIATQINESTSKQDKKSLRSKIKAILTRNIKHDGSRKEEGKRKVSSKLNAWLQAVRVATEMTSEVKQSALSVLARGVNTPLAEDSRESQDFRNAILSALPSLKQFEELSNEDLGMLALEIVGTFGDLKDMSVANMQDAISTLNSSVDVGKIAHLTNIREKREEDKRIATGIAEGIVSDTTVRLTERMSGLTSMLSSLTGLRSMFKLISSSGGGEANASAKKKLAIMLRAYNRADQGLRLEEFDAHKTMLDAIAGIYNVQVPGLKSLMPNVKDAFGVLTRLKKKEAKFKKYSNDGQTELSMLDMMQKYGSMVQEDGSKARAEMEERGITAESIRKHFSEADMELLNTYREYYSQQLPLINDIMKRIAGVPLNMDDPLYLPIMRVADGGTGIRETHNAMSLFPQYLVDRIDSKRAFAEDYDIHDVWLMRMSETAKFKHFVDINIKFRDILLHDKVLDAVTSSWGDKMSNAWRDKISLHMLGYVSNDTTAAKGFQHGLNQARKFWVGSKFFMNMRVGIKQITSVPAFATEIGMKNTGLYFKDSMANMFNKDSDARKAMEEIWSHPLTKERSKLGNSEALRSFLNNTTPSKFKRMLQLGRLPNTIGDIIPTLLVGQGIYRSKWNELNESGLSEPAAKEEAMSFMFEIVEATQQSGRSKDLADLQLSDSVFNKMLFTFKSTVRQYLEKDVVDSIALIRAEPDMKGKAWKDFGRTMAVNHLMLPALYNGMNMFLNWIMGDEPDEDDVYIMLMSMLLGPASAIPVVGIMIAGFMDSLVTGKKSGYGDMITPFAGAISDGRAVAAAINGLAPWTDAQFVDGIDRLLESSFAPYREVKKIVEDE